MRRVFEESSHKAGGIHGWLSANALSKGFQLGRLMIDIGHVPSFGLRMDVQMWKESGQFVAERQHGGSATGYGARTCQYFGVVALKDSRELLSHAAGDAPMLGGTQRGQLTGIPIGILPHLFQSLLDVFSKWRQNCVIVKLCIHPHITLLVGQPARPMTTIVRDVKNTKSIGNVYYLCTRFRIGIIDSARLFRRECLTENDN